uniref:Dynein regulatory complex protein 1 n=1 Tax=Oryzias latipes TaxID=8090 RepID=A0A3P9HGI3_ORYLA
MDGKEKGSKKKKNSLSSFSAISNETNSSFMSSNVTNEEPNDEGDKTTENPEEESHMRILSLHRDLTAALINIQTAAVAIVATTKLENAQGTIAELQEKDEQSSQKIFEELIEGWSTAHQKEAHQDLLEALESQQHLCAAVIRDKKILINDLKQELNRRHESYVRTLRKNAEELNLVTVMMEEKMKIMTDVYREESEQMERIHQQEVEILLTKDKDQWEKQIKALCDKELQLLTERKKKVKEYEEKCHDKILGDVINNAKSKVSVKNLHKKVPSDLLVPKNNLHAQLAKQSKEMSTFLNGRIFSLKNDIKKLREIYTEKERELKNCTDKLYGEYQRSYQRVQRCNQMQMKTRHNSVDAKQFKELQQMIDGELNQLAQRALTIDSLICQYLGLPWKQDNMAMLELLGPIQEQVPNFGLLNYETDKCNQRMIESDNKEKEKLCKEALETSVDPLWDEMKSSAGCSGMMKAVEASSPTNSSIHHKPFLPPLKLHPGLKRESRESSEKQISSSWHGQVLDASEVGARWERLANVIPEEKVRMWEIAQKQLLQHYSVLREISDLSLETENLRQKNLQLKKQLQERGISVTNSCAFDPEEG